MREQSYRKEYEALQIFRRSWTNGRKGTNVLRHSTCILKVDVLWSDLHIHQRSLDVRVPHQLHERGQAHTGADHVGGKGVSKAMRVGQLDSGALAMVTE